MRSSGLDRLFMVVVAAAGLLCFPAGTARAATTLIMVSSAGYACPAGGDDRAAAVAVDGSGNVIVTGYITGASNTDFFTRKYGPDLEVLNSATYNGSGDRNDRAEAVAVDGSGNVIVAGYVDNGGINNNDFFTIKYSPNLVAVASATCNSPGNGYDYGRAAAVDGSGNIIVTGKCGDWSNYYWFTIKYSPDLVVLSSAAFDGPLAGGDDEVFGVAVDGSNNVIVTGSIVNESGNNDYCTIKYDPNLVMLASATYNGSADSYDGAESVAVDGSGNIIVTGCSENASDGDYFTIKYGPGLTVLSSATFNSPGNDRDSAYGVSVDGSGNIIVTGYFENDSNADLCTIKYDPDLVVLASTTFNGPADDDDYARGVAVDASGSIFVTGSILVGGNRDYYTIKYNGPPAVTSVTPGRGFPGTTKDVSINGKNFYAGAQIAFEPASHVTVNSMSVVSSTRIDARLTIAADAPLSHYDLTVTNIDGKSGSGTAVFEVVRDTSSDYVAPDVINSSGTVVDAAGGGLVLSPESGNIGITVPPGAFGQSVTMLVTTITVPSSSQDTIRVSRIAIEIMTDAGLQPAAGIAITVYYRDADIAGLDENKLCLARYDNGRWIPIPTTVYPDLNMLIGTANHLSTFAVVQRAPAQDLSGVSVYPNPFNPRNGALTLANLTGEAEIRIFTVAGELVRNLSYTSANGQVTWDGKNDAGSSVASGVYLAFIKSPNGTKKVKIAVER